VANQAKRYTTIAISRQTKDALDSIKHPGQSNDGLVQEMLKFWKEKHGNRKRQKAQVAVGSTTAR